MTGKACTALGDTLLMHYKLGSQHGAVLENTFDSDPIEITLGSNDLAQNLEQFLIGLPPHERHVFMLDPVQAFGFRDEALIQRIALSEFPSEITPHAEAVIAFQMPNGASLTGRVMEVGPSEALVDFNHPLADHPVLFEVEILAINSAANRPLD